MYTCGPTVYDYAHIGNFRAYICADILRRYLEYKRYKVKQVMNLTDVDDKTIKNSIQQRLALDKYTKKFKDAFFDDVKTLNIEKADVYPEATKHVSEMAATVKKLMDKGIAYKGDDNSIYFDISKFVDYGKLSGARINELKAGARVSQDEYEKGQANDFALWKAWTPEDGDVFWETELGKGRPGWHIECSVMSTKYLGQPFDIHTGGIDLVFPHHENEIAQAEGAEGKDFVKYWIHNEWLLVEGKKMSKSLGNFFTLRDLIEKGYSPKAIRYLLLSAHYKVQMNFTLKGLEAAENSVKRLQELADKLRDFDEGKNNPGVSKIVEKAKKDFEKYMDDDLNISSALASLFDFVKEMNTMVMEKRLSKKDAEKAFDVMKGFDKVLGVLDFEKQEISEDIMELVNMREEARRSKDWAMADSLRDKMKEKGFQVNDTPEGPRLKKI